MSQHLFAGVDPAKAAIVMAGSGQSLSFGELDANSCRLANLLHVKGFRRGDHMAILMENNLRYLEVAWAGLRSGLYVTPVNRYLTAPEAAFVVQDSGAEALIGSAAMADIASDVLAVAPGVRVPLMVDGAVGGFGGYDETLAHYPDTLPDEQPLGDFMLYTSATTGRPKGVKRPMADRQVTDGVMMAIGLKLLYGFDEHTVYLSPAPLYHAAPVGFSTAVLSLGGTVVVMERFDEIEALRLIERHRVTASQWVPTMFVRMLKRPVEERSGFDLSSHRAAIHAAAPCPVPVKEQMIDWWGPIIWEYYAGTEGAGMTVCDSEQWLSHKGTVGRSLVGPLRICGDDGGELAAGETGTVYFEQPEASFEYHGDPEKTSASRHPDHPGWTTMGDIGHLDADGFLYLTDRKAFMIISSGVNIYPQEIENVLVIHGAVLDAAVIGIPNEEFGEEVKAVVELVPATDDTPQLRDEILAFCREHLASYKVPRSLDVVDALPRLPTGKLYKRQLLDRYLPTQTVIASPS